MRVVDSIEWRGKKEWTENKDFSSNDPQKIYTIRRAKILLSVYVFVWNTFVAYYVIAGKVRQIQKISLAQSGSARFSFEQFSLAIEWKTQKMLLKQNNCLHISELFFVNFSLWCRWRKRFMNFWLPVLYAIYMVTKCVSYFWFLIVIPILLSLRFFSRSNDTTLLMGADNFRRFYALQLSLCACEAN